MVRRKLTSREVASCWHVTGKTFLLAIEGWHGKWGYTIVQLIVLCSELLQATGIVDERPRSGRPRKATPRGVRLIARCARRNRFPTWTRIRDELNFDGICKECSQTAPWTTPVRKATHKTAATVMTSSAGSMELVMWHSIRCGTFNQMWDIQSDVGHSFRCETFIQMWNIQSDVGHSIRCGAFNQVWEIQSDVGHSIRCETFNQVWDIQSEVGHSIRCGTFDQMCDIQSGVGHWIRCGTLNQMWDI